MVLERIAVAYVKMLRASKAEAEHVKQALTSEPMFIEFGGNKNAYSPKLSKDDFESLVSLYSRYETSAENRFYKAINKLMELQELRRSNE